MSVDTDGRARNGRETPERVDATSDYLGWFRHVFADGRWEWSPQVQSIHGYPPGTVTPTTALVLSHDHPDEDHPIVATLEGVRRQSRPSRTTHRIVDARGNTRRVLVIAEAIADPSGRVVGAQGYYVDVTPTEDATQERITAAVAEIAEQRGAIEQAKGMLMLVYGIDADAAFDVMRWKSQQHNVKLRLLAQQIAHDFTEVQHHQPVDRDCYDRLLSTVHIRASGR
jgi:PAS domain S-box-containing protein